MKQPPEPDTVTPAEYQRLAAFRHALRRFLRFSEEAAIAAGIPPQQHQALLAIKSFLVGGHPVTIGVLAEQLQIEHHSAVGLVQRLIKEDLVRKHQGQQDRRQMQITLSHAAKRFSPSYRRLIARNCAGSPRNCAGCLAIWR